MNIFSCGAAANGDEEAIFRNRPVVCLVNGKTQHVAEIVAACLQDQGKAMIVGERTAGRAEIQNVQKVAGFNLKITVAEYLRPSGRHLSKYVSRGGWEDDWGVMPDAGTECRLSSEESARLAATLRDRELIYDPKFRPKPSFRDRQFELALAAIRDRIDRI